MAGKERSVEVVDAVGNTVILLDGDSAGPRSKNSRYFHDMHEVSWALLAASVDSYVWTIAEGVWQLAYARSIISVSGGASAAVTVVYCAGTTAIGSGVAQLTAAIDIEETAPSRKNGVLIASPSNAYPGDSFAVDFSGTLTGLVGVLTMAFKRVQ